MDALSDPDLRIWILQSQPASLSDAVAAGIEGETCLSREKNRRPRIRVVAEEPEATVDPPAGPGLVSMEMLNQVVSRINEDRAGTNTDRRGGKKGGSGGGVAFRGVCFRCQQPGHFARDCTAPSPCLLYTSPSPRDKRQSRMPSSA